jgi:hypothetical protein
MWKLGAQQGILHLPLLLLLLPHQLLPNLPLFATYMESSFVQEETEVRNVSDEEAKCSALNQPDLGTQERLEIQEVLEILVGARLKL